MVALVHCTACRMGDHEHHRHVVQAVPEGVYGGAVCACDGECVDGRYRALDDLTRAMNELERTAMRVAGWTCACCRREATEISIATQLRLCDSHAAMTRENARRQAAGEDLVQQETWDREH